MKEYETLTREKVDVVPFGCGMPETHLMQDWSDKMLDLILNGPTINGIKKDEVRAMLRETYTALKQYEKIGPMASPLSCWRTSWPTSPPRRTRNTARAGAQRRRPYSRSTTSSSTP